MGLSLGGTGALLRIERGSRKILQNICGALLLNMDLNALPCSAAALLYNRGAIKEQV
jgi:hypothetical protein